MHCMLNLFITLSSVDFLKDKYGFCNKYHSNSSETKTAQNIVTVLIKAAGKKFSSFFFWIRKKLFTQ